MTFETVHPIIEHTLDGPTNTLCLFVRFHVNKIFRPFSFIDILACMRVDQVYEV